MQKLEGCMQEGVMYRYILIGFCILCRLRTALYSSGSTVVVERVLHRSIKSQLMMVRGTLYWWNAAVAM